MQHLQFNSHVSCLEKSLVLGLRPERSQRCRRRQATRRSNDPKPMSINFSPLATASVTTDKKALMISSACFLLFYNVGSCRYSIH
ncbi:hypothetical protein [Nostoc foliaceum]